MSYNNHLAFSILKATPTTSTTNTNTTSSSPSRGSSGESGGFPNLDSNFPLILNILKNDASPKTAVVSTTTSLSGVTPTTISVAEREKKDLIDLLGKYDVDHTHPENDEDVDLLEEKMKQFLAKDDVSHTETELLEETLEKTFNGQGTSHSRNNSSTSNSKAIETNEATEATDQNTVPATGDIKTGNETIEEVRDTAERANETERETEVAKSINPEVAEAPGILEQSQTSEVHNMTMQAYVIPEEDLDLGFDKGDLLTMENTGPVEELLDSAPASPVKPSRHRNDSIVRAGEAVNPKERYQQSHKPFDFQVFLNHLKKKSADPIVRYIRSFLVSFSRQANSMSVSQMIVAVRQFKDFLNEKFQVYEPFASMDAVDLENSGEGVEKLIMNRLYDYCFSPQAVKKFGASASMSVFEDVHEDQVFALQVEKFSWILGIHLDVDLDEIAKRKHETSKDSMDYLDHTIAQLNKINSYRAPRDKIICILNSCKIIFNLLKVNNQETNADAFIPLLILVIIKAKTPHLISNLHYIERYRGEEWLNHGETSYYLSSMQGAITFVLNIKQTDLTIGQAEYDANMEAWEAELKQRQPAVTLPIPVHPNTQPDVSRSTMSPSDVLLASAEMFTKSISNFISLSPQERSPPPVSESSEAPRPRVTDKEIDEAFDQLTEVFPTLDKAILRDVIIMNKANVEQSLDVCLTLVNEN